MIVAGACSPVDRMYVTAKPGVTTLVMAENHTKTKGAFSHSARTAPVITVFTPVTALKTCHL